MMRAAVLLVLAILCIVRVRRHTTPATHVSPQTVQRVVLEEAKHGCVQSNWNWAAWLAQRKEPE